MKCHPSSTSGTYLGANPRCISANPSLCSNLEIAWSILFKFTVQSCSVANLMHVKRQPFISIIFDTFPTRFCPKSENFRGVGSLEWLNLQNCADLNRQDAGLFKTGHVFELQSAVWGP